MENIPTGVGFLIGVQKALLALFPFRSVYKGGAWLAGSEANWDGWLPVGAT